MLADTVLLPQSMSPCELCSDDSGALVLLVFYIPSCSHTFSASSSVKFPELREKRLDRDASFIANCYKVSVSLCDA